MNPIETPTAGLHYGVPYEDYAKWDAINFSRLKPIRDTASKCKYGIDNPNKPTPAMVLGSALHVAVLEPARFEGLFHICPPCDRKTKEGKEVYAEAEKQAAGKLIIREGKEGHGEIQKLRGMAASIRNLKAAAPFLTGPGQNEVSCLWKDEETGLMCKARLDRLIPEFELIGGLPVIVEVKTSQDACEWGFAKSVDGFDYDAQSATYRTAIKRITGKDALHIFIVCESAPPYDAAVYTLDDASLQTGLLKYRQMLSRYAECKRTNHWPGYPDKVQVLSLPKYAHERNYAN